MRFPFLLKKLNFSARIVEDFTTLRQSIAKNMALELNHLCQKMVTVLIVDQATSLELVMPKH